MLYPAISTQAGRPVSGSNFHGYSGLLPVNAVPSIDLPKPAAPRSLAGGRHRANPVYLDEQVLPLRVCPDSGARSVRVADGHPGDVGDGRNDA